MTSIALLGGGLAGKLAALYLARSIPDARITLVDPERDGLPVVGESTVEVTVQFFKALGLGTYLEEEHLHKYGLTYYFRLPPGAAGAPTPDYVQHEAPGVIRLPSYNLNRHTFDRELEARIAPQVTRIAGKVQSVDLDSGPAPQVHIQRNDGTAEVLAADHVIDCSGRARLLARQLDLHKAPPCQRNSYWFRLKGFDRAILEGMALAKLRQHCFGSYYVTHHFYGDGYWIWIIPMRAPEGGDMVSMGITYRGDVSGEQAMGLDRFCAILDRDHPALARLVRSGEMVDQSRYFNYMYEASSYYCRKGRWFLLGDSGFTFDPANSAGIAYLGHQIPQIASMILKARAGALTPCYVEALEGHLTAQLALQDQWSHWYHIMDDPVRMAWTLLLANMGYFHLVVPNYMSGRFLNAGVARQVAGLLRRHCPKTQPPVEPFPRIMVHLAETSDTEEIVARIPALYERTIPFSYYRPDNIARGRLIARYFKKRAMLRMVALGMLSPLRRPALWPLALVETGAALGDLAKAATIGLVPWIYERAERTGAADASAFQPPQAFLFPQGDHERGSPAAAPICPVSGTPQTGQPSLPDRQMAGAQS
ncbi:flavin-dependent dehydrogenase [Defluviimonas denitrificans]|uniref:Flavin-dependent dehydrogenase n=1 Tax=Albidovulum denitrificans TaxID=404881 RepID=A0A2S8RYV4_9RHOB|nr:tryptophan 7-halogenase [Defluviimonas denitrificans]PQV53756.1 flavin-dependent dehydrogenase [Defluviimonas denitrificans]